MAHRNTRREDLEILPALQDSVLHVEFFLSVDSAFGVTNALIVNSWQSQYGRPEAGPYDPAFCLLL